MAYKKSNANGQGTMANSEPVVIASDQTAVPVSLSSVPSHAVTNAGTFATQAAQSGTWTVQPGNTANTTAWKVDGSAVTQPVSLASVPSHAVTNIGTFAVQAAGTKTNNNAAPSTDNVPVLPVVANASSPSHTEGNMVALSANLTGNLRTSVNQIGGVTVAAGNGVSGTGVQRVTLASDSTGQVALAAGSATIGALTANQSVNNAQVGGVSVSTGNGVSGTGVQRVTIASDSTGQVALAAGTNAIGKLAANSGVDIGDVDVTTVGTITPGTAATSLGKAEDAGHTTGDVGVFSLGVRNDTLADVTSATADYSQLSTDLKGRVMTAGAPRSLKGMAQVSLSNTTTETTIIAATASTFHDVYGIILANTGATTTKVSIRDDTAGTVRAVIEVPTLETRGFMLPVDSAVPQTAVNKNWTAQCASATTALEVTAFYVSMV